MMKTLNIKNITLKYLTKYLKMFSNGPLLRKDHIWYSFFRGAWGLCFGTMASCLLPSLVGVCFGCAQRQTER